MDYRADWRWRCCWLARPSADQEDAPVLLVQLPEDAQMVENVAFDDGDFIQTYQLSGGAYVQLLRYARRLDVTHRRACGGRLAGRDGRAGAWRLKTVGGCAAQGALMLNVAPEDDERCACALVLVSADRCALVYQAVYPQRLERRIRLTTRCSAWSIQWMCSAVRVCPGRRLKYKAKSRFFPQRKEAAFDAEKRRCRTLGFGDGNPMRFMV
ncbi:MAG: hypothetical protein ACLUHE_08055 [Christensenellales bacterium]